MLTSPSAKKDTSGGEATRGAPVGCSMSTKRPSHLRTGARDTAPTTEAGHYQRHYTDHCLHDRRNRSRDRWTIGHYCHIHRLLRCSDRHRHSRRRHHHHRHHRRRRSSHSGPSCLHPHRDSDRWASVGGRFYGEKNKKRNLRRCDKNGGRCRGR